MRLGYGLFKESSSLAIWSTSLDLEASEDLEHPPEVSPFLPSSCDSYSEAGRSTTIDEARVGSGTAGPLLESRGGLSVCCIFIQGTARGGLPEFRALRCCRRRAGRFIAILGTRVSAETCMWPPRGIARCEERRCDLSRCHDAVGRSLRRPRKPSMNRDIWLITRNR
jgi:hypothetical protein